MRVAVIGATGLTGGALVPLLAPDHDVHSFGRRSSGLGVAETLAPAADWPRLLQAGPIDVAISALGTTWRKAGSWPAFKAVDHDAVVGFASAARAAGARQFLLISSVGADPRSRNNYLALKGQIEQAVAAIGFDRLDVIRPGLLRGYRGSDRRLGERFGIFLSPLTNLVARGPLDRFAAIDAIVVARAMARLVGARGGGKFIHHNRDIRAIAAAAR